MKRALLLSVLIAFLIGCNESDRPEDQVRHGKAEIIETGDFSTWASYTIFALHGKTYLMIRETGDISIAITPIEATP
jgi:hypothetical protein